jgi:hypothetical protein
MLDSVGLKKASTCSIKYTSVDSECAYIIVFPAEKGAKHTSLLTVKMFPFPQIKRITIHGVINTAPDVK